MSPKFFFFLLLLTFSARGGYASSITVRLIHRDSVHSKLRPDNLTTLQLHRRLSRYSQAHFNFLRLARTPGAVAPDTFRPMMNHDMLQYYVDLHVGTPRVQQSLLLSTSADLLWFQCDPCNPCFKQDTGRFVPSSSSTFSYMPCDHALCYKDDDHQCPDSDHCSYTMSYFDGMSINGQMGQDDLTFEDNNGGRSIAPKVGFGCTTATWGLTFQSTAITGILGLGAGGGQSLAQQLGDQIGKRFSHCLAPIGSTAYSYLRFGDDTHMPADARTTPLVLVPQFPTNYYFKLQDISVNGVKLGIQAEDITVRPDDGEGGVIADTSSWYTVLIDSAYSLLRQQIVDYFNNQPVDLTNAVDLGFGMNLCYATREQHKYPPFPKVTFNFEAADMDLGDESVFIIIDEASTFCLGIVSGEGLSIIGAMQMINKRIQFDWGANTISFVNEDCSQIG